VAQATWLAVNIDCPDPKTLAEFYRDLSGLPMQVWDGGFYSLGDEGSINIYFQPVEGFRPSTWPSQERGQQMHLDFHVDDLDAAVAEAERLGATQAAEQTGERWRVMLDPAGHPFCLAASSSSQNRRS